jgi:hypothetical protein
MNLLIRSSGNLPRRQGMAVIVVMALLSIILLYVMANARTLYYLKRDLRLVELQQTNRFHSGSPAVTGGTGVGTASVTNPAAGVR